MRTLYVGLMSGTSMDGIDAALCAFEGPAFQGVLGLHGLAYPDALRSKLLTLQRNAAPVPLGMMADLDEHIADCFAEATRALLDRLSCKPSAVAAIGSHGQTVFHDPTGARSSLQLGDPNRIAALTGITTVADFRRKDIALGGQGAPLVPAFHQALFGSRDESRCVLNIGGIANLTLLPKTGAVRGFDTGPGNGLMDEWVQQHRGQPYDADGAFAAQGTLREDVLETLLGDAYFAAAPPKSTGRHHFHPGWALARYPALQSLPPADVQRSFAELTACSIADALHRHAPDTQRLLVCGGGARNAFLMQCIRTRTKVPVESTALHGLDPQAVEAAAFAWLAMRTMNRLPGNLPAVTGASREAVLGGIYLP